MASTADPTDPTVTDRTMRPTGVIHQSAKTWVMLGMAGLFLALIFFSSLTSTPSPIAPAIAERATVPTDAASLSEMQRRIDEAYKNEPRQAVQQPPLIPDANARRDLVERDSPAPRQTGAGGDSLAEERRRRQYESLFASSVAGGRRVGSDSRDAGSGVIRPREERAADDTLDRTAEAVVRASRRVAEANGIAPSMGLPGVPPFAPTTGPQGSTSSEKAAPLANTPPIEPSGPTHPILEGTVIDGVLTNRLDGSSAAPVNIQVTNPIYSHRGDLVLIPAGAKVLGEAKPVQNFGESRIAVSFHRLIFPDGSSVRLDGFKGLNQAGDNGLKDQVNNHYVTTFAVGAVTGLVTGIGQAVGNLGLGGSGSNRTTVITGGAGNGAGQAANQTLSRLSNRLPTVTIREGQRVKVYLTSDLELPAYPVR